MGLACKLGQGFYDYCIVNDNVFTTDELHERSNTQKAAEEAAKIEVMRPG